MSVILELEGLVVGYEGNAVAAPVDLVVRAGELLAVIGANGVGKSTLLRTVLGLQEPLGGVARVFGDPVDERRRDFRTRVSGVMDDDATFPGLTVREHLVLSARGHGVRSPGAVVDGVLDAFGIIDRRDVAPDALSSGQRRRFLLAGGFVRPRELLVLDEPEQRLDTAMRTRLAGMLVEEAASGTAVLFATHDDRLLAATGARALHVSDDDATVLEPDGAVSTLAGMR